MIRFDMKLTLRLKSAILFEMFVFDINKIITKLRCLLLQITKVVKIFHFYLAH